MKEIVSYGGGTQSTALILMALEGKFNLDRPDFGVIADVGAEPEFVNKYVDYFTDYCSSKYNFDIFKIQHKEGLEKHLLADPKAFRDGKFYTSSAPPFYTLAPDGTVGMLMRQCTSHYKINPITKFINSKLERGDKYNMNIGISFDERSRMKVSTIKRRTNNYPLVSNFINRQNSIDYIASLGVAPPQRSSCYFCPFHSNRYWEWLNKYHNDEFERACEFEKKIQENAVKWKNKAETYLNYTVWLHKSCKPLADVKFSDPDQLNMFPELIDECDALCGI